MSLNDLKLKNSYTGKGELILEDFLIPSLLNCSNYDRITGFYSAESLIAISQGVESLYERNGKMRLIIGVHSFPEEFIEASIKKEHLRKEIERVRREMQDKSTLLHDELIKQRVATIAWMIEDNLLEVKAAATVGDGIFHPKTLLFSDDKGNCVVGVGSSNETAFGLGGNFEQLMVAKSWEQPEAVKDQIDFFNDLWNNKFDEVDVFDISEETEEIIRASLGYDYILNNKKTIKKLDLIKNLYLMPSNYFVSGNIPALFVHQERAVIDALSRWPVRVLFADEVGLGKTFETAATLMYLVKYCNVKRVLILTPKAVLKQWQDELYSHFGLNSWMYDSGKRQFIDNDEKIISVRGNTPISKESPDVMLMSVQYARGTISEKSIFDFDDAVLPDLLIVDEAHSARQSMDISGNRKKTKIYKMIERISRHIPHIILATATPMQRESAEYHAMLKLLGLPKIWQKERNFELSLKLVSSNNALDNSDAAMAASLLCSTLKVMNPCLNKLNNDERIVVEKLIKLYDDVNENSYDTFDLSVYVNNHWNVIKNVFIKLHPARLLTVRNTRRSLTDIGYSFPERNLNEETIYDSVKIQLFYNDVYDYISNDCFSVERVLNPDKKVNVGFVRANYQQRTASSLNSCIQSLKRRLEKMIYIKGRLNGVEEMDLSELTNYELIDDLDEDDSVSSEDMIDDNLLQNNEIDIKLDRAVNIECAILSSLVSRAEKLMDEEGDKKILTALKLAKKCINEGDIVLLFSRYTDTVNALICEYNNQTVLHQRNFGVYTGDKSYYVSGGTLVECDKNTLKEKLFNKEINIVFCSDAASEGLNLQAARVLINVDVPWTPSRLEQRIGRIARLGQTAKEVDVYNIWYPNSIEAKMYHRIQQRLKETNLAIGEFPEVISNSIRQAVLNDSADNSLEELNEYRNSNQVKALKELWMKDNVEETISDYIRTQLIDVCEYYSDKIDKIGYSDINKYIISNFSENLTSLPGLSESVSLKSEIWNYIKIYLDNCDVLNDCDGNVSCFSNNGKMIDSKDLIHKRLSNENIIVIDNFEKPVTIPGFDELDMSFSVDADVSNKPSLWPPKDGDEYEN